MRLEKYETVAFPFIPAPFPRIHQNVEANLKGGRSEIQKPEKQPNRRRQRLKQ